MLYRIEQRIRTWRQWSPAEQRKMDAIVAEIMRYVIDGEGNTFVAEWCKRNLSDVI